MAKMNEIRWVRAHRCLTVDPGIHTGWALFNRRFSPSDSGVFSVPNDTTQERRLFELGRLFLDVIMNTEPDVIVVEDAEYRSGSRKSRASQAHGSLSLLMKIVGGYSMMYDSVLLLPAREWKGNLSDEAVARRVFLTLRRQYRQHEQEAVGIGLAIYGTF